MKQYYVSFFIQSDGEKQHYRRKYSGATAREVIGYFMEHAGPGEVYEGISRPIRVGPELEELVAVKFNPNGTEDES